MTSSRIAFVISGKSPKTMPGGLGAYAYNVARVLNSIGYQVVIVGFDSKDEVLDLGFAKLVHFSSPFSRLLGLGSILMAGDFARVMEKSLQTLKVENGIAGIDDEILVYSAGFWGLAGEKFKQRMKTRGIRVRTWVGYFSTYRHEYRGHLEGTPVRDYGLLNRLFMHALYCLVRALHSPIEHGLLKNADRIIVHYDSTSRIILREIPDLEPSRLVKIPYCVELFEREGEAPGANLSSHGARIGADLPVVTVLCRQDPRKGIHVFLRAVKILKERGVQAIFQVAGSGIFLETNKKLNHRLGLENDVRFLGFVNSTQALLERSDIYVLPALEEGSGAISLLEAMKSSAAIVTTYCDGIPEDFTDGETALLTTPGNPKSLADAIEKLVRDPRLRERLGEQAGKAYLERFGMASMEQGIRGQLSPKQAIGLMKKRS